MILDITLRRHVGPQLRGRAIAGTGHRPNALIGYSDEARLLTRRFLTAWLRELAPSEVVSGMALGFDWALAEAAVDLELPLVAAVPFRGQEARWPERAQAGYRALLDRAAEVVVVSEGGYSAASMQRRNEYMVDRCELLLALFNGKPGGTANCLDYAAERGRDAINLWSSWQVFVAASRGARAAEARE